MAGQDDKWETAGDGLVFIGYGASDADAARELADGLSDHDIDAWSAAGLATGGAPLSGEDLEDRIDWCDAFLLLFSAETEQSDYVARELELADECAVPVLTVRLDASEPDRFHALLRDSRRFDWSERGSGALSAIAKEVKRHAGTDLSADELLEAAINHPMNVASRRHGLIIGVLAALLVIGGIAYGILSGL